MVLPDRQTQNAEHLKQWYETMLKSFKFVAIDKKKKISNNKIVESKKSNNEEAKNKKEKVKN